MSHGRRLIVQRRQGGWKQAHIVAAMGVSRKCVKTWIDRYAAEGEPGLLTGSSRPHSMPPPKTDAEVEQSPCCPRRASRRADVLGPKVGVPARTVSRILRRHDMAYLRECDSMTGNAWADRYSLRAIFGAEHGITQRFIKPACRVCSNALRQPCSRSCHTKPPPSLQAIVYVSTPSAAATAATCSAAQASKRAADPSINV